MAQATISSKNQIVIPKEARQALDLRAGDEVLVLVRGKRVLVLQNPASHGESLRGLAKKPFPKRHVENERQSWD